MYPGKYPLLTDCVNFLHKVSIIAMTIMFCIAVPVRFALTRVLHYGYKEQLKLTAEIVHDDDHASEHQNHGTTGHTTTAGYYTQLDANA